MVYQSEKDLGGERVNHYITNNEKRDAKIELWL